MPEHLPERPVHLSLVLALVFALISCWATAQSDLPDTCGYTVTPWTDWGACATLRLPKQVVTSFMIEGNDTLYRTAPTKVYANAQRQFKQICYVPGNARCKLVVYKKVRICK